MLTIKTTIANPILVNEYIPRLNVHISEPQAEDEYLKIVGRGRIGKLNLSIADVKIHVNLDFCLEKVSILNAPKLENFYQFSRKTPPFRSGRMSSEDVSLEITDAKDEDKIQLTEKQCGIVNQLLEELVFDERFN